MYVQRKRKEEAQAEVLRSVLDNRATRATGVCFQTWLAQARLAKEQEEVRAEARLKQEAAISRELDSAYASFI